MDVRADLRQLAAIVADWANGRSAFEFYIFGSRVRGTHRHASDVDLIIKYVDYDRHDDYVWLRNEEAEDFATLKARLPGELRILEYDEPVARDVLRAAVSPQWTDRNVVCVWLKGKE